MYNVLLESYFNENMNYSVSKGNKDLNINWKIYLLKIMVVVFGVNKRNQPI